MNVIKYFYEIFFLFLKKLILLEYFFSIKLFILFIK